ncbi:glycosyltransferase family 2 protein [Halorubrum sp. CGM4_25_10-8A]|uniref:glycosyltransferase family 2 protein n=1 Tax=Halorubrum sp. CGM4_25_10-8A TaxID=2518116 RepID=UPI00130D8F65|nr:glycosyltransferase family 2 protein [Halorubrum sp. CGM4_25_10-8A]
MRKQDPPKLSILILNYNGRELLEDCIISIKDNTTYPNYEIVLIDNNSSDNSVSYVRENHSDVQIVQNSENLGFAEANNRAIKSTNSEYVLLLNNDTEVGQNWLKPLVELAESAEETKVVSPKLVYENGDPQFMGDKIILRESGIPKIVNKGLTAIEKRYDRQKEIYRAIGAAMLIQRNLFEDVGYLDENYAFYMEEFDFCLQTKNQKYKILYTPESEVIHKSRTSAGTDPYYSYYLRRRSRVRFYLLNFSLLRLLVQLPIELATVFDSIVQGYSKWVLKAYYDSLKQLPSLVDERRHRQQYNHTTNKFRTIYREIRSFLDSFKSL